MMTNSNTVLLLIISCRIVSKGPNDGFGYGNSGRNSFSDDYSPEHYRYPVENGNNYKHEYPQYYTQYRNTDPSNQRHTKGSSHQYHYRAKDKIYSSTPSKATSSKSTEDSKDILIGLTNTMKEWIDSRAFLFSSVSYNNGKILLKDFDDVSMEEFLYFEKIYAKKNEREKLIEIIAKEEEKIKKRIKAYIFPEKSLQEKLTNKRNSYFDTDGKESWPEMLTSLMQILPLNERWRAEMAAASEGTLESENVNAECGNYSEMEKLTREELSAFENKEFTFGKIPIKPPPRKLV